VLNVKWDRRREQWARGKGKWELRDARELIEAAAQVAGYLALTGGAILMLYQYGP
jgi:hypothetical protein